jgi:hypothetical protein
MGEEPLAKAHQAIGAYFCAFSALERELGEAIKVIFRLQAHEASDAIVAAIGNMSTKINLVWFAFLLAKNTDRSETAARWKEKVKKTMGAIEDCNGKRNQLAHSFLKPKSDGSVELVYRKRSRAKSKGKKLKGKDDPKPPWTQDTFKSEVERLNDLAHKLRSLTKELSTFTISTIDWRAALFTVPPQLYSSSFFDVLNPHSPGGGTANSPLPSRAGSDSNDT